MTAKQFDNVALRATGITLILLSTVVFGTRMYLGVFKQHRFGWEDGWLIASWVVFVVISSLYLNAGEVIFRLQAVAAGEIELYPTVADDGLLVQKTFFVTTSGLWICLWLVKASLLSLYKRLFEGLRAYMIAWWCVVVICVLALAGAIASSMLSCSSMKAWFTAGACGTPRDIKAAYISLWYSYAVDVFTDLLVMLLPLGLIRNLQMHWKRKASIASLFGLGWICIGVSTIRAAYLGKDSTGSGFRQPSTSWLALWAIVEGSIAVIIGCGPGLYREAKVIKSSRHNYYDNQYNGGRYIKGSSSNIEPGINLQGYPGTTSRIVNNDTSSQEELVEGMRPDKIMVTRSVMIRDDRESISRHHAI